MAQNDYSLEELLKLAESDDRRPEDMKSPTAVEKFIQKLEIVPGEDFVPNFIIHYHYFLFRKVSTITRRGFFIKFSRYFKKVIKGSERGYLLDSAPFEMSQDTYFKARAFSRKGRRVKKTK